MFTTTPSGQQQTFTRIVFHSPNYISYFLHSYIENQAALENLTQAELINYKELKNL